MTGLTNIIVAIVAFVVTATLGIKFIPFLRKVKFGQTIKEIGPTWHKNKQGTPTMGGILFMIGVTVAVIVGFFMLKADTTVQFDFVEQIKLFAGLGLALAFGFVGFVDDYIKVVKKQNLGLKAGQKIVMQIVISAAYLLTIYSIGDTSTIVVFPFLGQIDFGFFYYPLMILGILFFVNAVNLTDGVDGLASSVTFVVGLGFIAICGILQFAGLGIFATAIAAACLGFLVWNFFPAKVFMGDTGSMFLGGAVVGLALGINLPIILGFVGIIYLIEALSVVIQVISFKTTGKRVFKMSPIHHHFEMLNWSEVKIVCVFSLITLVMCGLAIVAVFNL